MKKVAFTILTNFAFVLFSTASQAQSTPKVTIQLKNNGAAAREFRFLERHPADKLPNVFTAFLRPGQFYQATLKAGTTLSQVTQPEINATMRGQRVLGRFLLVVQRADSGRTINLVKE